MEDSLTTVYLYAKAECKDDIDAYVTEITAGRLKIERLEAELEKITSEYDELDNEKQDAIEELTSLAYGILEKDGEYAYEGEFCESSDFAFSISNATSIKELVELMANEIYRLEKKQREKQYDGLPDYIEKEALKAKVAELEESNLVYKDLESKNTELTEAAEYAIELIENGLRYDFQNEIEKAVQILRDAIDGEC